MGLFDKIKKAIDDSGVVDAAKAAVKSFTESTESKTVETPQKQIVEKKVAETEVKETKPKAPPKPACEQGKCATCKHGFCGEELYFTCDESIKCSKKSKCKENFGGLHYISDEGLIPVAKAYASERTQWQKGYLDEHKAAKKLIATYVPALKGSKDLAEFISVTFKLSDIGSKNPLVVFFVNLNKRNFDFLPDKKEDYITVAKLVASYGKGIDINQAEWLYNPSLYESDDLEYLVKEFINYSDKEWLGNHLIDASVVDLQEFYNNDGTIKRVGDDSEDGSIKNIIHKWRDGNVNEEFERRLKICDACQKRLECKSKGLHPNCPSFLPFGVSRK